MPAVPVLKRGGVGRAPISVVVPTLNAATALGPCLEALAAGLSAGLIRELILADGGSDDDIVALADAVGARLVESEPGRGTQLAAGASESEGEWLLFLHADTVLEDGWVEAARRHMLEHPAKAAYFRLRYDATGVGSRIVSAWANCRSWLLALPYGDQGLLISRTLYRAVGGYREVPLMEDVGIIRSVGRRRMRRLDSLAMTDFERYRREGWALRGSRNLICITLYFAGVSPERLARLYTRSGRV